MKAEAEKIKSYLRGMAQVINAQGKVTRQTVAKYNTLFNALHDDNPVECDGHCALEECVCKEEVNDA